MGIKGDFNISKMDWKIITTYVVSDILGDRFLHKSKYKTVLDIAPVWV